jgi:hypothetical protein
VKFFGYTTRQDKAFIPPLFVVVGSEMEGFLDKHPGSATLLFCLFCPRFQAHFHEMHSQKGIRDLLTKGRLRARKKPPKETIVDLG